MKKHYQKSANGTFAKVKALLMLLCVTGIAQAQLADVLVMSIEGKMVSTRTSANEGVMVLNTDNLSNGVYLVQVISGDKQVTKKITVQK